MKISRKYQCFSGPCELRHCPMLSFIYIQKIACRRLYRVVLLYLYQMKKSGNEARNRESKSKLEVNRENFFANFWVRPKTEHLIVISLAGIPRWYPRYPMVSGISLTVNINLKYQLDVQTDYIILYTIRIYVYILRKKRYPARVVGHFFLFLNQEIIPFKK